MADRETVVFQERTFIVGERTVIVALKGDARYGEEHATWTASTFIPFREGEDAPTHFTIGAASIALGAVLALGNSVRDKAEVVLHLTPHGPGGLITPVYNELQDFARLLDRLAWGTFAKHPGHPTFEEVPSGVAA